MVIIIKLIGAFILGMGIVNVIKPVMARRMLAFWRQGNNLYIGASIRLLLGILFLLSASSARLPGVMVALGVLTLIGGGIIFVLGIEKIKPVLAWYDKKSDAFLRLMMLVVFAFGGLLVYAA